MKAAYIQQTGPPQNIRYGELPMPVVGERDVLVRVAAVAVNPIDTYIRAGAYPIELPSPFIIGRDMTGVVESIGSGVSRFQPGDRVWCNNQGYNGRQGTFAEFVAVEENLLYPLPEGVDILESVAVLHSALTAVLGLFDRAGLRAGESLFVNGGSGNVGNAVLQIAKAIGARVAVTAGDAEKAALALGLGADAVIDYKTDDVNAALAQFAPRGVDVYWDATKKPDVERILEVLSQRGRIILMAGLDHRCPLPVGAFYTRNCSIFGFTVTDATVAELAAYAERINEFLGKGLVGKVDRVLPLSEAAKAHQLVEAGGLFGKVVLVPGVA